MSKVSRIQGKIQAAQRLFRYRWRRLPLTTLGVLLGIAAIFSLMGLWGDERGWRAFLLNLGTDLIGAVVTYALIDLVLEIRQEKESLIRQMGSSIRDVALAAAGRLREESWHTDGSLEGANLLHANLERADLTSADLEGADLRGANLKGAGLWGAYLRGAILSRADLQGAVLSGADLQWAVLAHANLERANLWGANLEGTNLQGANLEEAGVDPEQLARASSLRETILPNGTALSEDNWQAEFKAWQQAGGDQGEAKPQDVLIGNISTKIFHLTTCRHAGRISEENLCRFGDRDEAIEEGYTPCSVCNS